MKDDGAVSARQYDAMASARVLAFGGVVVFSTQHSVHGLATAQPDDYFTVQRATEI